MRYYLSITSKFIFTIIVFFSFLNVYGQENEQYSELVKEASHFYELKNYKQSVENYLKAFKIFEKNSSDLYNAACSAALNNDLERAKVFLISAIENGWTDADHLQKDPDLYQLHSLDDWFNIVKRAKEAKENTITKAQLIDSIQSLIKEGKPELVYELATEKFKSIITLEELKVTINSIHDLLQENGIESWQSIKTGSNSSTSFINGLKTEAYYHDYAIIPNYLGRRVKSTLIKPKGYYIKLSLIKNANKWFLSNLLFENAYKDLGKATITSINNFFEESDSLIFRYSLLDNGDILYSQGKVKSDSLINEIMSGLMDLEFIEFSELKNYNVVEVSGKMYSLSFYSKEKAAYQGLPLKKKGREKNMYTFELMFEDNNSNLLLVSNNNQYGFYKVKSIEQFKKIVLKSIADISE